eukprot:4564223-Pleurochrysis_carterae.AAC.1
MAQSLIKVSSRAFVALRPRSTQRAAGHAEAERKRKKRYERMEHQVPSNGVAARKLGTSAAKFSGTFEGKSLKEGSQARMMNTERSKAEHRDEAG